MNTSTLVFLYDVGFTFIKPPNSLCFKFNSKDVILTLYSLDKDFSFFGIKFEGNFYRSTNASGANFKCLQPENKFTLFDILSKDSLAIEFNHIGIPETIAFFFLKSKTKTYLTLDLTLTVPPEHKTESDNKMGCSSLESDPRVDPAEVEKLTEAIKVLTLRLETQEKSSADLKSVVEKLIKPMILGEESVCKDLQFKVNQNTSRIEEIAEEFREEKVKVSKIKKDLVELDSIVANHGDIIPTIDEINQIKSGAITEAKKFAESKDLELEKKFTEQQEALKNALDEHESLISRFKAEYQLQSKATEEKLLSDCHQQKTEIMQRIESLEENNTEHHISPESLQQELKLATSNIDKKLEELGNSIAKSNQDNKLITDHINNQITKIMDQMTEVSCLKNSAHTTSNQEEFSINKNECGLNKIINFNKTMFSCLSLGEEEYAVGCDDGSIHIRDKYSHIITKNFPKEHCWGVRIMIKVEDKLISGSNDNNIIVWNLKNNSKHGTLSGHTNYVISLIHVMAEIIASGSKDGTIKLWDFNSCNFLRTLTSLGSVVFGLAKLDYNTLISVNYDGYIRFWETSQASDFVEIEQKRLYDTGRLISMCLLSKSCIAVGSITGEIKIWNVEEKQSKSLLGHKDWITRIERLSSILMATCSTDFSIRIWNIEKLSQTALLEGHTNYIYSLIKLNNFQILSVSEDRTLRVWGSSEIQ